MAGDGVMQEHWTTLTGKQIRILLDDISDARRRLELAANLLRGAVSSPSVCTGSGSGAAVLDDFDAARDATSVADRGPVSAPFGARPKCPACFATEPCPSSVCEHPASKPEPAPLFRPTVLECDPPESRGCGVPCSQGTSGCGAKHPQRTSEPVHNRETCHHPPEQQYRDHDDEVWCGLCDPPTDDPLPSWSQVPEVKAALDKAYEAGRACSNEPLRHGQPEPFEMHHMKLDPCTPEPVPEVTSCLHLDRRCKSWKECADRVAKHSAERVKDLMAAEEKIASALDAIVRGRGGDAYCVLIGASLPPEQGDSLAAIADKFPRREATPEERAIFDEHKRAKEAGELTMITSEERARLREQRPGQPVPKADFIGEQHIYIAFESISNVPCFVGLGLSHLNKQIETDKARNTDPVHGYPYTYNVSGPWVPATQCTTKAAPTDYCAVCKAATEPGTRLVFGDYATCSEACTDVWYAAVVGQGRMMKALREEVAALKGAASGPYRVGRTLRRTLYLDDKVIGLIDTEELAAFLVRAANEHIQRVMPIDPCTDYPRSETVVAQYAGDLPNGWGAVRIGDGWAISGPFCKTRQEARSTFFDLSRPRTETATPPVAEEEVMQAKRALVETDAACQRYIARFKAAEESLARLAKAVVWLDCGHWKCFACKASWWHTDKTKHATSCPLYVAAPEPEEARVLVACRHGYDACPICDVAPPVTGSEDRS